MFIIFYSNSCSFFFWTVKHLHYQLLLYLLQLSFGVLPFLLSDHQKTVLLSPSSRSFFFFVSMSCPEFIYFCFLLFFLFFKFLKILDSCFIFKSLPRFSIVSTFALLLHFQDFCTVVKVKHAINHITFSHTEANPHETLYISGPKLSDGEVILLGSFATSTTTWSKTFRGLWSTGS